MLLRHGCGDYIGEEVSQLEHALQAADLAQRRGEGRGVECSYLVGFEWFLQRHGKRTRKPKLTEKEAQSC